MHHYDSTGDMTGTTSRLTEGKGDRRGSWRADGKVLRLDFDEGTYVANVLGMTAEAMDLDGAIVTTEGFGNNHMDFAGHIEQLGRRGIPVVATNHYMNVMIELNKSVQGIEDEILENNCLATEDAVRAAAMLKTRIAGGEIKQADDVWNPDIKANNTRLINEAADYEIVQGLQSEIFVPVTPPRGMDARHQTLA